MAQSWSLLNWSSKNYLLCGTRRFITVFTNASQWTLPWACTIQATFSYPIRIRSLSISTCQLISTPEILRLKCYIHSHFPNTYMCSPPHPPRFNSPNNISRWVQTKVLFFLISPILLLLLPFFVDILCFDTLNLCSSLKMTRQISQPYKTRKITVLYTLISKDLAR